MSVEIDVDINNRLEPDRKVVVFVEIPVTKVTMVIMII